MQNSFFLLKKKKFIPRILSFILLIKIHVVVSYIPRVTHGLTDKFSYICDAKKNRHFYIFLFTALLLPRNGTYIYI